MNATDIEWADSTWNPVTGCTPASEGCLNCYAKRMHERFNKTPFSDIVLHPGRLMEPVRKRKGARIFVGSMTDIFHDDVPFQYIDQVMHSIVLSPRHTFQLLTKRPDRMARYFRSRETIDPIHPLPNLWLGVTVENQENIWRVATLLDIPAAVHFVSVEPMIGEVNFTHAYYDEAEQMRYANFLTGEFWQDGGMDQKAKLDWVIVGGETGRKDKARLMHPRWVNDLYAQCKEHGTPFFFKQWGAHVPKDADSFPFVGIKQFPEETS